MTKWEVTSEKMAEQTALRSHPSTETLKNKQKLSKLTFSELWTTKVYRSQTNAESRKRQLKNGRKALWHLYLPLPYPTSAQWQFQSQSLALPVDDSGLWSQEEQTASIGYVHSNLSGGTWRTGARRSSLFHLMQDWTQGSSIHCLKTTVRLTNYPQSPGAKDGSWDIK